MFFGFGLFALVAGCVGLIIGPADIERLEPWERVCYRWLWPAYFSGYGILALCYWWRYGIAKDFSHQTWLRGDQLVHTGLGGIVAAMILHRAGWPAFIYIYLLIGSRGAWRSDENRALFRPEQTAKEEAVELTAQ